MSENPILGILKVLILATLAFFISMVFWQRTELEDKIERLITRVSALEERTERASGAVELLATKIKSGQVVGGAEREKTPEDYAWGDTPPPWVKGRAAELWGTYGENFLERDPNWPTHPSLDDPKLDPAGSVTYWYGSNPPDTNAFTLNESDFNTRVRVYCESNWAAQHSQDPYHYRPELAYRVERSPDYKTWIFWIRPGVRWHTPQVDLEKYPHLKGEHVLTARDWKFTVDTVMNPEVNASHTRSYLEGFDRCEVVDDLCFIMHWKKPTWTAMGSNLNLIAPVPEFVYGFDESGNRLDPATLGPQINEHWFGKEYHFVGCGPYYVKEFRKESVVVSERFNEYWGPLPAIKKRIMHIIPSPAQAQTKFEAGEFCYQNYRMPDLEKKILPLQAYKDGRIGVHPTWSYSYSYIAYKNTHPFFSDVRVRTAMTHACNRKRMLDLINKGRGKIVTGPQYWRAPTSPADVVPLPFDLDKARALLAEAGWADADDNGVLEKVIDGETREFRVTAKIPSASVAIKTIFDVFQEDLAKIGVQLEVQSLQWSQFLKEVTDDRKFEICSLGWSTGGWDNDMTQIWHSSQIAEPKSSNFIEFSDPEVDRLIEQARTTFDPEARKRIQGEAHRRIHDLQPYTFLFTLQVAVVWWRDQISDMAEADAWLTRPFIRLFPAYVPSR